MSQTRPKAHVFVDFDGTITAGDATDMLFGAFALPQWLDIEADWQAGRIGSRECMARQVDLIRATPEAFDAAIDTVAIDPDFAGFVDLCRLHEIGVTVVSDGLDRTIGRTLERHGLGDLTYFANRLDHLGGDRWRLGFPYSRSDCRMLSGNCKCQFAEAERAIVRVMIGDGRSDFCIASRADMVLAKGALARHCRESGLAHVPIERFAQASALLQGWLRNGLALSDGRHVELGNELR